jgi:hypothetical protein
MRWFSITLVFLILASACFADYSIDWYTINGGGGRSSGGPYTLTGTIGQPDAAYSAGGGYELLGGFWPGGPLCVVDFESYALFAENWLREECSELNNWCDGADLYVDENNIVDRLDLKVFVEEWLCYCPVGWPLK